jgi:hypothetical protein
VLQNIFATNTMCEYLTASVLLMARANAQLAEYHYKNHNSITEMKLFIKDLLNEFRIGLATDTGEPLAQFMQLTEQDFELWLDRTAIEIVYWTALQPNFFDREVELPQGLTEEQSERLLDSYSVHLNRDGRLNPELYPVAHNFFSAFKYPRDFQYLHDEISLGKTNGTFPLIALIRGITRFTTEVSKIT